MFVHTYTVDEKDRTLIAILQRNGREKVSKISRVLGLSEMGTKKRLDKLIQNDLIKVKALINTQKLDLKLALIAMEVESAQALKNIVDKFKDCPRVIRFFVTTGGYNLFALVWADDIHTLESISLERCSLRAQTGVRRFEFYPIQEVFYESYLDLKVPTCEEEYAPCGVHCGSCERYKQKRCTGCPATRFYRGKI